MTGDILTGVSTALRLVATGDDRPPPRRPPRPSSAVIAELAGVSAQRPDLLRGPVQELHDLDAAERTQYVPTLRAYFDAGRDVQRASRAMFLHRNTMRYRLDRIRILTGLDLHDPVDRLVAELQLRLHDLRGAVS